MSHFIPPLSGKIDFHSPYPQGEMNEAKFTRLAASDSLHNMHFISRMVHPPAPANTLQTMSVKTAPCIAV